MRRTALAIAAVLVLAGCTGPADGEPLSPSTVSPEPEEPSTAEQIEAVAAAALADRGFVRQSRPPIDTDQRVGVDEDRSWRAQGFPDGGIDASLHSVQATTDDASAIATANLYVFPVPRGTDPCDVPWTYHPSGERPCDVADADAGRQMVTVEYTNLREMYLVDEDWVLNLNVSPTSGDGELAETPVPLSADEQRDALLDVADGIPTQD